MKVKELFKNYGGYTINLFGKPLSKPTIPYTHMPKDKDIDECVVVDYIVEERDVTEFVFDINGNYKGTERKKGIVKAYIK